MSSKAVFFVAMAGFFISYDPVLAEDKPRPAITEDLAYIGPDTGQWKQCSAEGTPEGCHLLLLHGDPEHAHSGFFIRISASSRYANHWHTGATHVFWIEGNYITTFADGRELILSPGSYMYIPGGMIHGGYCSDKGPCLRYEHFDQAADFHAIK